MVIGYFVVFEVKVDEWLIFGFILIIVYLKLLGFRVNWILYFFLIFRVFMILRVDDFSIWYFLLESVCDGVIIMLLFVWILIGLIFFMLYIVIRYLFEFCIILYFIFFYFFIFFFISIWCIGLYERFFFVILINFFLLFVILLLVLLRVYVGFIIIGKFIFFVNVRLFFI